MYFEKTITFDQMERFLKRRSGLSPHQAYLSAIQHYTERGGSGRQAQPFPLDLDVVLLPDDLFIQLCGQLPVRGILPESDSFLSASALFPHNYECFIVRHLNPLGSSMHRHDFFELCYVWAGGCTQATEAQTYTLSAGDFLIIPPGIRHKVTADGSDAVLFNIMVRTNAFLTSSFPLLSQNGALSAFLRHCLLEEGQKSCLLIGTDNGVVLKRIVKHLTQECYTNQELFCDFAINIFNQLLCYVLMFGEIRTKYLHLPDHFSLIAILHEIQQNYQTVTLKSLADKFFFSEEHLSRLIKKATGKTFSALLREARIKQATLLLTRTDLSMDRISGLVGYSDASSFNKAFKAIVGQSPAQYRKQGEGG